MTVDRRSAPAGLPTAGFDLSAGMDDLVLIHDAAGRCQQILTPQFQTAGWPLVPRPGHTWHESWPEPAADRLLDGIQTVLHTQRPLKQEYQWQLADRSVWLEASLSPVDAANVLLLLRDISSQKQLELEREQTIAALQIQVERLRLGLEFNQIGCWDWFIDEQKLVWDEQCFRLLGVAPTQAVTFELWKSLIHPDDLPRVEQHLAESLAHQTDYAVEYRICLADGTGRWLQSMGRCLPPTDFPQRRMIGIAMDISDRKTAELLLHDVNAELTRRVSEQVQEIHATQAALQQREHELSSLLAHLPDIISRLDRNLYCLYVNPAITAMGFSPQDLIGKDVTKVDLPRPFVELWATKYRQVLATKAATSIYIDLPTAAGILYFEGKIVPEFDDRGDVVSMLTICRDITPLKETEIALRESEEKFRTFFKDAPLPIGLADVRTYQMLDANTALQAWLGYTNEELCAKTFLDFTYPEDVESDLLQNRRLQSGEIDRFQLQKRLVKKTGEIVWADIHVKLIRDRKAEPLYNLCVSQDITVAKQLVEDRNQAEANLRVLLQEKEILLKEVHHRVKNNLQIVSSLLRMQSRQVDDHIKQLFQEAQSRVHSIAMIHEHLYQSSDLSHIAFADYVQTLITHLFQSYGVSPDQIRTDIRIQTIDLDVSQAIACGLIINEIVSNSLKYAFVDGRPGVINIYLNLNQVPDSPQKQGILTVEDNGVGIPADVDWQTSRSLGLRIIRAIAEQINGSISLNHRPGTSFQLTFPLATP